MSFRSNQAARRSFYGDIKSLEEIFIWIKELKIRGATAIGIAGAYGLYIALR